MWLLTLRDLQWRRRRFAFGVVGTALVFAVTLLLAGFSSAIRCEADRTIDAAGADGWVVREGVSGPFSGLSALPVTAVPAVVKAPGVRAADPLVIGFATLDGPGSGRLDVTLFGHRPNGLGAPVPAAGRPAAKLGEAVVDRSLGVELGESFTLSGRRLVAVGEVGGLTLRGGAPNVYVTLLDAQAIIFEGTPLITTVLTSGLPDPGAPLVVAGEGPVPPSGLTVLTADEARVDLLKLFSEALGAIDLIRVLLWVVAVAIVGTVIYLSVMERLQDFAVLLAIGTRSRTLLASLAVQAVLIAVLAAAIAAALAQLLAPTFTLPLVLSPLTSLLLLVIAIVVGVLASAIGMRRVVRVDPAAAFGGP